MKTFAIVAFTLVNLATANPFLDRRAPPGCIADNCLRALTVTDSNLRTSRPVMAKSDCSVHMRSTSTVTVTPTTTLYETISTVTSTTTTAFETKTNTVVVTVPTTTTTSVQEIQIVGKRAAYTSLPSYLSPCSNAARLSSACLCIGVTATVVTETTTLPTSSLTISTSTTSTASFAETATITKEVSTTTSTTEIVTSTIAPAGPNPYCVPPFPHYGMTCTIRGYTNELYTIRIDGDPLVIDKTPTECHVLCIETDGCLSFQTAPGNLCFLNSAYTSDAKTSQEIDGDLFWYDVDCPEMRPPCF